MTDLELFKAAKRISGLKQPQIALLSGKSLDAIQSYESGRLPVKEIVFKVLLEKIISDLQDPDNMPEIINDMVKKLSRKVAADKKKLKNHKE